jgi:hypothetical protein
VTPNTARQLEPDHTKWNPDYPAIIRERWARLERMRARPELWDVAKAHYANREGLCDFVEDWCWTFDPRVLDGMQEMPMVLFPRQRDLLLWLYDRWQAQENGLVDKSRDVGLTWLCVQFAVWGWLFHGMKVGFGSRKQDLVDRIGDPDSIFEKIRMTLGTLPAELLPQGFDVEQHANFLKVQVKGHAGGITGEAGDNIGRGGRNATYFVDESAFLERPKKIDASLSQNTNNRIDLSTTNGIGTSFDRKRRRYPKHRVFVFDWKHDPRKGPEWYAEQERELDPMVLAMEVDRNPEAAAEDILIPAEWVRAAMGLDLPAVGQKAAGLDVADEGPDSNAYVSRTGPVVQVTRQWKKGTTTQTARKALAQAKDEGITSLRYDSVGVGAGVKGELTDQQDKGQASNMVITGVNTGGNTTRGWLIPPDKKRGVRGKRWKDHCRNLKAEAHWRLRLRFQRTYEHVKGIKESHPDDMISLPADAHDLQMEISGPKYEHTDTGLIKVESKKKMDARGIPSPNLLDALVMAFCPLPPKRKVTF